MLTPGHCYKSLKSLTKYYTSWTTIILLCALAQFTSCIEDKVDPLYLGSIHGTILSKYSNESIADVKISTAPATSVVYTNAEGRFEINNIPEGEYTIITEADNYARESIKLQVVRNASSQIDIKLSSSTILAPPPYGPVPASGTIDLPLSVSLNWTISKTSEDSLSYTIKVYQADQITPFLEVKNHSDTTLLVENLRYNTTYHWQVDVLSSTNYVTSGELWVFKTIPFPDNRILFSSIRDGNFEIYSADQNGDLLTRITHTSSYELKPQYSNTREVIAYAANPKFDFQIYTMNKDGSGARQVTTIPIAGYHSQGNGFSWSPDNGKFIYSHNDKLYRIDKDGVNLTLIANARANRNFRSVDWTALGNKIVAEMVGPYIYDSEIYLMNANGSDTVRIVDNLPGIIGSPSFSIDGREIMFTHDVSGFESEDGRQLDARIFVIDIDTKTVTALSGGKTNGTNDLQPRFSPDGAKIIFVNALNDGSGIKSIWTMSRDGSEREQLFTDAEMPSWK